MCKKTRVYFRPVFLNLFPHMAQKTFGKSCAYIEHIGYGIKRINKHTRL